MSTFEVGFESGKDRAVTSVPVQAEFYCTLANGMLEFYEGNNEDGPIPICTFKEWTYVLKRANPRSFSAPEEFTRAQPDVVKKKISAFSSQES